MNVRESERIPEHPRVETIPQAVKVIQDLHTSLSTGAPLFTEPYWDRRLLGRVGGTWHYSAHTENRFKIPHLNSVLVANGTVLLGSSVSEDTGKLVVPYYLSPLKDSEGGMIVGETGWVPEEGFSGQPRSYITRPSGIILESVAPGRIPWAPIDVETAEQLPSVNDELRFLIEKVQEYQK